MNKIFRIARLELSVLFYSPIAWLLLIIFIIQSGLTFTDILYNRETNQQLGRELQVLSKVLFAGDEGLLTKMQQNLYLYIPLLTMGLLSRETSSGSIKLLFSSPVKISEIVLGKFMAMVSYCFLLILVLMGFLVVASFSVENLDIKFVLGGIFGLFLLICAYSAIGLFMSSLTSYQVVAAISTLGVLAALNFVGEIGQSHDFVRDITYWLSMSGRSDNFINGLVSSKDIIYFLLVIGLFLALTIMKLSGGRQTRSAAVRAARYSLLIALVIMAGYISSLPALTTYYDTTRFKDRTLTKNSQEIVKQLSKPVKITTYINAVDYKAPYGAPKYRIKDLKQFEQYQRFLPDLKIEYVTYYDTVFYNPNQTKTIEEQARRAATAHGFDFDKFLKPEEIRQRINLIPEENLFTRVVEHDGKTTFLRMFNDMFVYPHEPEISAALKRLLVKAPVVGVLQENDERSIDKTGDKAYKMILKELTNRSALVNQGFDVINVSLNEGEIPRDISVLLIADPKMDYSAEQLAKISSYIEAGGNLIVAGEPGRQTALNSILSQVGVKLNSGLLLQQSEDFEADLIQARFTENARAFGFTFNDRSIVTFPGANGISLVEDKGFKVTPLLMTDKTSTWNREEQVDLSKDKIVFDSLRETKIQVPVAVALTRNIGDKEQKIIVTGDADFMTNAELNRYNIRTINPNFITKMFKWFSNGEFPIDTSRKESIDKKVLVTRSGITWMKVFILGVIPFLIGAMGGITLIRRKRQ